MKFISMNQLKSSQTASQVVEEKIQINPKDIPSSTKNIKLILDDLEKLKEALEYKHEEIQKEINQKLSQSIINDFENFANQFSKIKIDETGPVKNILDDHKQVIELKRTYRMVNLLFEIKKGNECVLDNVMENKDDWPFLSHFFKTMMEDVEDEDLIVLLGGYKRKLEEKILSEFEIANLSKDKGTIRVCYSSLDNLNKRDVIVKSYMHSLPIFKEVIKYSNESNLIDLDLYENNDNSFFDCILKIEDAYNNELNNIEELFADSSFVYDVINKRLFEDTIMNQLEYFLDTKNPTIFLLNLKLSIDRIDSLVNTILSVYPKFISDDLVEDLFTPYLSKVIHNEKESFDDLFDLLTRKKTSKKRYNLYGDPFASTEYSPLKNLAQLIILINLAYIRKESVKYEDDAFRELKHHYVTKINEFVNITCASFLGTDQFELIKTLTDIYLIMKRYFQDQNITLGFQDNIESKIQDICDSRMNESERKIKSILKPLSISNFKDINTEEMKTLYDYILREYRLVNKNLKGRNSEVYLTKMLKYTFLRLHKYYLNLIYDLKEAEVFLNDIKFICGLVREMNLSDSLNDFQYFTEVAGIVAAKKEDVKICIRGMSRNLPEEELKKILKCRKDYKHIKKIVFNQ